MSSTIIWDADPVIFQWEFLTLRWYGVFFGFAFIFGAISAMWILKRESKPTESLDSIMIHMMVGTLIGARLGHCLFYDPVFYLGNPLEIVKIWKGGLASHGAGVGIILSLYLYSRKNPDQPFFWILDRAGISIALGCSLIRLGNLFNSEILGKPTASGWGIIFKRVDLIPRHPAQLYESAAYFIIFLLLLTLYLKTNAGEKPGLLSGVTLLTLLPARLFIELFKENQAAFESGWFLNMGQILSFPFILFGVYLIVRAVKKSGKTFLAQL